MSEREDGSMCGCGHTFARHGVGEIGYSCLDCMCGFFTLAEPPVQEAAPEPPVTPQELRTRARLIREGWTFYEAPQIAAELDEPADWMARHVK